MIFSEKRYGRFQITDELIQDEKQLVMDIMSVCIVLRAEHFIHKGVMEYYAYSEHFEKVPEGIEIPYYAINYHDGKFQFNKE